MQRLAILTALLVSISANAQLRVSVGGHEATLSAADISSLPKCAVDVRDPHSGEQQHYEGARMSDILEKAGVALGEKMRGAAFATYVLATASDGYKVVFSLAELDPEMNGNNTIIAQSMNGKALDEKSGPLKIVVPNEKRPARWVRMLTRLDIVKLAP
ncbi:MAG: molybdopterin-dependent oxidoreductase [Acidobacteria bacterium]|nr:molybdopterin-dependent oxidoreductase [Acidobacteriota bacterium]